MLKHPNFKGIAFIIAMRLPKFNKYLYSICGKAASSPMRACLISDIRQQETKSSSSNIRWFIMEIMKSKQMHKFRKSLNISLVKTSTVLVNCFKSYRESTVSQKHYQGSYFLPFHLFNFLTFTYFQSLFFFLSINV